mmetsp:Transcript_44877/g.65866  ORF Transcript_44877/g.65866 Transcript_44877/m.65866 type:complete len:367 (-) Transcript_44877:112-1212(-)
MSSDANLRFIKDYVTCHGTAPTHTTTYSRGTFPEDVPWDFDTWRDQFRIKILEIAEDDMVFDMTGIDVALANAFRRILLAEVPTMAIEKVFVHNNTGVLRDELVAQRLGMIPIKADPSRFEWPDMDAKNADERANLVPLENQVLKFRLKVKCRKNTSGGVDNDPINGKVLSNQLEWVPVGNQAEEFACDQPAPVHSDILIARLRPGQEIDMEMHCHKGNNSGDRGHAKWSPVATAWYRLLPRIDILSDVLDDEADRLVRCCPMSCFDIEDFGGHRKAIVSDKVRDCTLCRECIREPEMGKKLRLARKKDHFIFSVESTGIVPPADLFKQSVKVLREKAVKMLDLLEQLEGELAVQAMDDDNDDIES